MRHYLYLLWSSLKYCPMRHILTYLSGWSIDLHWWFRCMHPAQAMLFREGSSIHQPSPQAIPLRVGARTQIRTGPHTMILIDRGLKARIIGMMRKLQMPAHMSSPSIISKLNVPKSGNHHKASVAPDLYLGR